jgi:hypothetical protein
MDRRRFVCALAGSAIAGPAAAARPYRAPRTRFGAPDLEGTWSCASFTTLERPDELKSLVLSPAEAAAWEGKLGKTHGLNIPNDPVGQLESEFPETGGGLARIRGQVRSSWIIDPPDGKIPWTEAAKKALHVGSHGWRAFDNPEDRPHNERCLAAASTGAPILSSEDANVLQIVQTPEHVVILTEKYHDARVAPLGAAAARSPSWLGDSVARWEGDTLVVRTGNFRAGITDHGDDLFLSDRSRVDERFTRIGPREILYEFAVTDPALFTQTWRAEMLFNASPGALFEYACHEGNYSLPTILQAARLGNQPKRASEGPIRVAGP